MMIITVKNIIAMTSRTGIRRNIVVIPLF